MKDLVSVLKGLSYFESLSSKEMRILEKEAYLATEPKNKSFMASGAVCQSVYFIVEGRMRVYKVLPDGKEITLYRIGNGEMCLFSMNCLINQTPLDMFAKIEKKTVLLVIPGDTFSKLITQNPIFQRHVMSRLLSAFSDVLLLLEEVTFHNMNKRLSNHLLSEIATVVGNQRILKRTHEEIAFELGTAREVVSRLLKEFEKQEIVSLSRGQIKVLNVEKLMEISNI